MTKIEEELILELLELAREAIYSCQNEGLCGYRDDEYLNMTYEIEKKLLGICR